MHQDPFPWAVFWVIVIFGTYFAVRVLLALFMPLRGPFASLGLVGRLLRVVLVFLEHGIWPF